jgi:hypothetical protein
VSQTASPRRKNLFVALFALAVVAVVAFALWRLGGDDAKPLASGTETTATTTMPTTEATTPSPTPTATPSCEGPHTQFNVAGIEQDSLLPDCGVAAVTHTEEKKSGLGLACGGTYPVILFKTTTTSAKTSICGTTPSGEDFRFVTRATGGQVLDLPGAYDPQLDAFVARKAGTTYTVRAYDGTLLVTKDGTTTKQKASDWISLDNESDYD